MPKSKKRILSDDEEASSSNDEAEPSSTSSKRSKKVKSAAIVESGSSDDESDAEFAVKSKRQTRMTASTRKNKQSSKVSDGDDDDGSEAEDMDGLRLDPTDKEAMSTMTEKEREEFIFKKLEQQEAAKTRRDIHRRLEQRKRKEQQASNSGVESDAQGSSDGEPSAAPETSSKLIDEAHNIIHEKRGRTTEAREKESKHNAMRQLKARREEQLKKQRAADKAKSATKDSDLFDAEEKGSDSDAAESSSSSSPSEESEPESGEARSGDEAGSDEEKNQEIKELKDLNALRMSRFKLTQMLRRLPIQRFTEAVRGCFVRCSIGTNGGKPVYRAAEIVDVVETHKVYAVRDDRDMDLMTNKGLKLRHGNSERMFRLEYMSNTPFSESEFWKWKEDCTVSGVTLPTHGFVEQKKAEIDSALRYRPTDSDLDKIIEERKRFKKNPTNFAYRKNTLLQQREIALQNNDKEMENEINQQLDELEERASALELRRSANVRPIDSINQRNRTANVKSRFDHFKNKLDGGNLSGHDSDGDPFTRKKSTPRLMKVKSSEAEKKERKIIALDERRIKPKINPFSPASTASPTGTTGMLGTPQVNIPPESGIATPSLDQTDFSVVKATPVLGSLAAPVFASTPANVGIASTPSKFKTPQSWTPIPTSAGMPGPGGDDPFSAHADIDLEIDLGGVGITNSSPLANSSGPTRHGHSLAGLIENKGKRLNLEDYKRRKGLI